MYSTNRTYNRNNLDKSRLDLAKKIQDNFKLPQSGVVIIFDDNDFENDINPVWRNPANYFDLRFGHVEEMSSEHILDVMKSKKYAHIIWLAKRTCNSNDMNFSWKLSHEFRHLEQSLISFELIEAGEILNNIFRRINKSWIDVPTELDAQLCAWRVVSNTFSIESCRSFIQSKIEFNNNHYKVLIKNNPNNPPDLIIETLNLLKKYKDEIKKFENEVENDEDYFNFDNIFQTLNEGLPNV